MLQPIWKTSGIPFLKGKRPLVMAHRGRSAFTPESSFLAFKEAYDLNVDVLETDIRITKDGIPVIFHDETLDRTTNGKGKISDFNLDELMAFDLGYWHTKKEKGEYPFRNMGLHILPLQSFFEKFPRVKINLDIKDEFKQAPSILFETIKDSGAEQRVLVGSFHNKQIIRFREISKHFEIPTSANSKEVLAFVSNLWIFSKKDYCALQVPLTHSFIKIVTASSIKKAHRNRIAVHPWTINNKEIMLSLLSWKIDGIFTDDPELLIEVLNVTD
ncbi:MAG: glycerophosphodiester phosphodiesterase [Candidatus Heimdallarchaeaceae archaeon]